MPRDITTVNYSYYDRSGQSKTGQSGQPPKKSPSKPVSSSQPSKLTTAQLDKLNVVNKDRNWIQTVSKEKDIARTWQKNWAFVADYDPKGEMKTAKELPRDRPVMFSDQVPNTTSGHYGAYLDLEPSRSIQLFEQKFNCGHRKKPIDSDLARP